MGELRALDWSNVDLAGGLLRVEKSWDRVEGLVEPKSKKSKRTVAIPSILRGYLVEHRKRRFALGQRTASSSARRTSSATTSRKMVSTFTTSTPPCCTSLASIIRK